MASEQGFPTEDEAYEQEAQALFEGDQGTLPAPARRALTLLLSKPYVCALDSPEDYLTIEQHRSKLERSLNDLGLQLMMSPRYEVAYARQAPIESGGPLVIKRSVPLRRDATILLVSIRARQHNDEANGEERWFVDREDLKELLRSGPYAAELDDARVERALDSALRQLADAGYVRGTSADGDRYRVMPILPAVFTLERARELLDSLAADGTTDEEA